MRPCRISRYEQDGNAFVDGEPVAGDRMVKLEFDISVPTHEAVEVFALSDGVNFGVVLVNLALDEAMIDVDFTTLAEGARPETEYAVSYPLHPGRFTGDGLNGTVRIPAQDSAFLYVE